MTDPNQTSKALGNALGTTRRAAAAHTAVSGDLEAFLRRVPETPSPADVAEYAVLLAREEAVRAERDDAAEAAGLTAPSVSG